MKIPGFTIQRELGHGGMATVYLAMQDSLQRPVALKIMSPVLCTDPHYVERFLQEGRIVAHLAHPYIVTIYDVGVVGSQPYMAMEYIEGGTLQQRIERGLTLSELFPIIRNVAHALAYAHARHVIHRDVKPGNIMFHADGKALLGDFGIAKAVGHADRTANLRTGAVALGTPYYMSPEQVLRRPVDARADQYGLGVVLYECLTGRVPFRATDPFSVSLKHLTDPVPRLTGEAALFQPMLDRLMAKEPQDRYPDDRTLLEDLSALTSEYQTRYGSGEAKSIALEPAPDAVAESTAEKVTTAALTVPLFMHEPGESRKTRWRWPLIGLLATAVFGGSLLYQWGGTDRGLNLSSLIDETRHAEVEQVAYDPGVDTTGPRLMITRMPDDYDALQADQPLITLHPELAVALPMPELIDNRAEIRALLEEAEQHLVNDRLMIPADENAYEVYRRILALEPAHPQALAGLQAIAERYVTLAESARGRGRIEHAQQLVERGLRVQPEHVRLNALRQQLQRRNVMDRRSRAVDPCVQDRSSRACWCQTFSLFCD